MIYLYGLLDPSAELPLLEDMIGVTGEVLVTRLPEGYLIYGPHDGSEIMAKRRFLLAHARVLEDIQTRGTVLPMRFGMSADSVEAVSCLISERAGLISERMSRLDGLVELGLRISYDRDAALDQQLSRHPELARERDRLMGTGRSRQFDQAEFGRKLGEALDRHRTDAQRALLSELKAYVSDFVLRTPEDDVQALAADVLIASDALDGFAENLLDICKRNDFGGGSEPHIKLVGPVPAYNFVRLSLTPDAKDAA